MIEDSSITFKQLAALAKTDQRTIAKRYEHGRDCETCNHRS
jgi:hypothetical protein